MPLLKSVKTPTGAQLGYHVVTNISIDTRSAQAVAILAVHSWPDEAHYQLAAGGMAAWHWTVPVPVEPLQVGGPLMEACEDVLRALPDDLSPFAGASVAPLAGDLDGARARQWALVKQTRDSLDAQPVAVDGIQLDADPSSRVDILGAIMAMQLGNETERVWRCTDNVMRTLTLDQLVRAGRAVAARRQALIEQSDALAQQIQNAQTVEAVTAVVWPT
ncbi:DUF4376 domain-containing protein [Roseateles chitosanitabidus]|uniref:DUF4376 domain-containing protein n=1 Tax=Roseateles chitosanitabidus TaxID=65048 RepID=UPI0008343C0F|nr:DUF4376 domain-containing protein [Roseateles chitosanitabidus]